MSNAEEILTASVEQESRSWQRFAPQAFAIVLMVVVAFLIYRLVSSDSTARKSVPQVVTVKLVQPPPPPPPPPKPEEPVKEKQELKPEPLERPTPTVTPPPLAAPSEPGPPGPPGPPGIAGLPSGGGPGGPIGGGGMGGSGTRAAGNPFGSYLALLQSRVQSAVQKEPGLRRSRYHVQVRIWMNAEGTPQRVELAASLGSADLDRKFRDTLLSMGRLPQSPPADMPQPVVLKVNSL